MHVGVVGNVGRAGVKQPAAIDGRIRIVTIAGEGGRARVVNGAAIGARIAVAGAIFAKDRVGDRL